MNADDFDTQEYDFSNAKQGAVAAPTQKRTQVMLRLDDDVLDWFRNQVQQASGGNYQELINLALHDYISRNNEESLEATLRRVIREEMNIAA